MIDGGLIDQSIKVSPGRERHQNPTSKEVFSDDAQL